MHLRDMRLGLRLGLAVWHLSVVLAFPTISSTRMVEMTPTKGLMLMRTWQTRAENMNVLKTVPDGKKGTKLKVVSAVSGDEGSRRSRCKEQFSLFSQRVAALGSADAGEYPEAQRQLIPELNIGGKPRGPGAKVFASVGEGASTLSIVECNEALWSVLSLCVSPDARDIPSIVQAEAAALEGLRDLCANTGASLRVNSEIMDSLAGSNECLKLIAAESGVSQWLSSAPVQRSPAEAAGDRCEDGRVVPSTDDRGIADGRPVAREDQSVHQALRSRRTVNDFAAELPDDWEIALRRAIEAATLAPNHKRTEPWRFHLLGKKAARRVCELNAELVAAAKGKDSAAKKLARWLEMPGWLVVTCLRDEDAPSMEEPNGTSREDYAACCCAVQNLCLSLHADEIGTKWTTGPVNFDPRFREAAGLPADEYVVGTIWFGRAVGPPPPTPSKRLSIDDVLCIHD